MKRFFSSSIVAKRHFCWKRVGELKKWPLLATVLIGDGPFFHLAAPKIFFIVRGVPRQERLAAT